MGRFVHGSVLTLVAQDSMPISTAIRSLRQNSSSWSRRRATASNVPSSKKALFCLVMMPPKNRSATPRFVLARAQVQWFPARSTPSSKTGVFGTDWGRRFQLAGKTGRSYLSAPAGNLATHYWSRSSSVNGRAQKFGKLARRTARVGTPWTT